MDWDLEVSNKGEVRFKKRGIVCEASTDDLSIAGVRYRHSFLNDFEVGTSYHLLGFPSPSSDRVEMNLEVSIGESRYSVGRWRDAQGLNAYFMWGDGADNNFIPTHDKRGKIRCRRMGEKLYGEFWDGNQWVTIGKREVNSQEARISFKAFNSTSKRKVSVHFSNIRLFPNETVPDSKGEDLLIFYDPQVPVEEGLKIIEERFPNTAFSILCHPSDPIYSILKDKAKGIYEYHYGMSLRSQWRLLKRLRQKTFLSCIYIGKTYDLLKIGLIRFCKSDKRIFLNVQRSPQAIERKVRIFNLFFLGLFRFFLWTVSCPLIFLLYGLFGIEGFKEKQRGDSARKMDRDPKAPKNGKGPVSIVIPNYNGKELMAECLPTIVKAVKNHHPSSEVILVDDASHDESVSFLQNQFPEVKIIGLAKNQGFGKACNRGVGESNHRIVILLNSDIACEGDFISSLVRHFEDPSVFAAQPKMFSWDRIGFNAGMNMGRMEGGYIRIWNEAETRNEGKVMAPSPNLYAIGGAMAFDKAKWNALGGFDDLFYPFCWEDIDISYRAWKRGWKVLYEPQSLLFHKHHGTLSMAFQPEFRRIIEQKNEMVFMWKNIHDPSLIKEHLKFLPLKLLSTLLRGDFTFARAFFKAFCQIPGILKRRRKERNLSCVKDKRVLEYPLLFYRNFMRRGFRHPIHPRKQILIMNPVLPYPPVDGGKNRVFTFIKFLSKKYDIHLLTFIENIEENEHISKLQEYCAAVDTVLRNWTPLPRLSEFLFPTHCRPFYSDGMKNTLLDILKTRPIDLVQIEFTLMAYYINFIRHVPTVFTEHDISVLFPTKSYNPPQEGWRKIYDYLNSLKSMRWEMILGNQFDKIVTVTDADKRILSRLLAKADIETIPTGTDMDFYSEEYQEVKGKGLAFVGFMGHYPNLDAMIYFLKEIYPLIKMEEPEASLTIIGKGGEEKLSSLREDTTVRITGYVEDLRPILREACVFVAPMRIGAGIKGKLLEAIAMHKPIVTTSLGCKGLPLIPDRDILVSDSPEEFARKAVYLIRNPEARRTMSLNAHKIIREHYDWNNIVKKLDSIYCSLIYDTEVS